MTLFVDGPKLKQNNPSKSDQLNRVRENQVLLTEFPETVICFYGYGKCEPAEAWSFAHSFNVIALLYKAVLSRLFT